MPEYTKKDPEQDLDLLQEAEDKPELIAKSQLWELAIVFAKLGAIAFGEPAAHIAAIEVEVVQRRQWLSRERLLDLLSISNLIPGPNSTGQ